MNRRVGQTTASSIKMQIRVTAEERDEWKALAEYCETDMSGLIRRLIADERARLLADGKRPPKRPRTG